MRFHRHRVLADLNRPRLGETQERQARSDVRLKRRLVDVMAGTTAYSHTKRADTASTVPPTIGKD